MSCFSKDNIEATLCLRIIPCLDVSNGRVVKGVKFQGLRDAGCPEELAARYQKEGADELVFLDVSATDEGRATHVETIRKIRKHISIPLTTGGGIKKAEDAQKLLEAGADKVSVNTAAVLRPGLVSDIASEFGSQCAVLAIDAAKVVGEDRKWEVVTHAGKKRTGIDVVQWAVDSVKRGAGEILLTSWDRDGTREGYDLGLLSAVTSAVNVPVIASGGADSVFHMKEAIEAGAHAVLAASIFHDGDISVYGVKEELEKFNLRVRK